MAETRPRLLRLEKLADRSGGQQALEADLPGEPMVTAAAPPGVWPLAGVTVQGDPPRRTQLSHHLVQRGRREGWIDVEGEDVVHRPGGPPDLPYAVTHTFFHHDVIIIKTVDGDVRYRVVHQPDKYAAEGDDDTPVTDEVYAAGATRVDWIYRLELEG